VRINQFKRGLQSARQMYGLWLGLADPYAAEICAGAGFDWLMLDGEHAPNDVRSLLGALQAIAPYPGHPVVRIPSADVTLVKQVLDIGAQTILVPAVDDAAQALLLARAMRYPPDGTRGVGTALARAARWGAEADYLSVADAEACLIVQIETLAGVRNAAAIAAVDGVDALFIGPADLAASLGYRGQATHPKVREAIEALIRTARSAGKPVGTLTTDPDLARHYLACGCSFIAVGVDTLLLRLGARELAQRYLGSNTGN
jgi:4-hydroxy-2-oxoheptanedioate aldolase